MFGPTDLITIAIAALCVGASVTDLLHGKIYNIMTAPALVLGVVFAAIQGGWLGAMHSVAAAGLGIVLYGWMYWIGIMGAGDVKFLAALGALGGTWQFVTQTALYGVLFGGVMALVILVAKGKFPGFLARLRDFAFGIFVRELEIVPFKADHRERMPYGVSISVAAIGVRVFGLSIGALWGMQFWGGV